MPPEVATLIGVVVGSLLTGALTLANTVVALRAERRRQQCKDALAGLLSIHDALTEMSRLYGKFTSQALNSFTSGQLKPLDGIETSQAFSRLSYLLGLYAPEMISEFEKIRDASKVFMDQWTAHVLAVARGQQRPDFVVGLTGKLWDQAKDIADFQARLASYAHGKYFKG